MYNNTILHSICSYNEAKVVLSIDKNGCLCRDKNNEVKLTMSFKTVRRESRKACEEEQSKCAQSII